MNIFNLFHVLSLVSLQTIGKTVNNNKVATLGNIHYAHSYNKTKTAVSDRIHSTKITKQKQQYQIEYIQQKMHPLIPLQKNCNLQK